MRAKFGVNSVTFHGDPEDEGTPRTYLLTPIYDTTTPENERFTKATPSGEMKIRVDNPNARLEVGEHYYLDFTPTALAQHQKTPETMGNVHDAHTRAPEPDRYGSPAAGYQPQHAGYTTTGSTATPAAPQNQESRGYTETAPAAPDETVEDHSRDVTSER